MKVKTYGVPGLTEWLGTLKAGSLEVSVSFSGGTSSPSGAQPAYFVTRDPIVQLVIEHSKEYKSGFIILVMSQEVAGDHPRMAVPKPTPVDDSPLTPAEGDGEVSDKGDGEPSDEGENVGVVDVADKSDAIEWLKEHFPERGYTAVKLRTAAAFEAACKECGVVFRF